MIEQLAKDILDKKVILFVGSGVSASLEIPTWSGLVNKMGDELGYDPKIFSTFGDNLTLAEFYKSQTGSIGKLRSWMDREWHKESIKIEKSRVHNLIAALDFPIIYTTNYDRWIENSYDYKDKPYKKIVSVNDLRDLKDGETQIVKFHGDFDNDNSIVLTESDYFNRLDFESPLDIRLRSDAMGKSILFIGYSLTDLNIRFMFYKLMKAWDSAGQTDNRPKSFIFMQRPNPAQSEVLKQWGITTLTEDVDDPNIALQTFLENLCKSAKIEI